MVRTRVNFDEREYIAAKQEANRLGISISEFVRRAVRQSLSTKGEKPWMRYAGFVASGDANASQSIDEVVYRSKEGHL
jgi:hypothetical protein